MKEGKLIYDKMAGRYDVCFSLEDYYGGLHCGECFEVKINGKWKKTRIEKSGEWYLVGINTSTLLGLEVRI